MTPKTGKATSRAGKGPGGPVIPWQDAATPADRKRLMKAAGVSTKGGQAPVLPPLIRRIGAGPGGRHPGRVALEARVRPHTESTRTLRGLYSWVTGAPLPIAGPLIGRDLFSGGHFCPDPWQLRRLGLAGDTGVFISGVIGSGKSSLAKTMVTRHTDFGRPFVVSCDIRGEWVPVAQAVDGTVLRLGPGMPDRLNALAMPGKPAGITPVQWWLTVRTHWEELLVALIETVLRGSRDLTPTETTAIEVAITAATRYREADGNLDRLAPIHLQLIVDLLLDPTPAMADETRMTVTELAGLLRESGLALRKLTRGSLQGLVDAPEANQLDPASVATVVDISRVQTSDASIALVMACTQAATELAWAHHVGQRWHVYDEFWRIATFGKLVARLDGGRRISRKTGAADMIISHRGTDHLRGDAQAQRAAKDLMDNCATKVTYRHGGDGVPAAAAAGMPDMAAQLLPTLARGQAVWMLEQQPYVVQHLLAPGGLEAFVETDQAMEDSYRTLADTPAEQLWHDA
jgi:hypothetical protein